MAEETSRTIYMKAAEEMHTNECVELAGKYLSGIAMGLSFVISKISSGSTMDTPYEMFSDGIGKLDKANIPTKEFYSYLDIAKRGPLSEKDIDGLAKLVEGDLE